MSCEDKIQLFSDRLKGLVSIYELNICLFGSGFIDFVDFCRKIPGMIHYFAGTFITHYFDDIVTPFNTVDDDYVLMSVKLNDLNINERIYNLCIKIGTAWIYENLLIPDGINTIVRSSIFGDMGDNQDLIDKLNELTILVMKEDLEIKGLFQFVDRSSVGQIDYYSTNSELFLRYLSYLALRVFVPKQS